jgi:predicted lipoprotein
MRWMMFGAALVVAAPVAGLAQDHAGLARRAYEAHILPGFEAFDTAAAGLAETAKTHCAPRDADLRAAYQAAFDAWMGVQHLRFGPTEVEDRAYALAFWPDTKGRTPAGLNAILKKQDPAVATPEGMAAQSIAVRGFFALDYLLYDPAAVTAGAASPYGCALIQGIAGDIARIADEVASAWAGPYGAAFLSAGADGNTVYLAPRETTVALFTALMTGLEANKDQRLGRPMGTFEAPTPLRAEARRSDRPRRNLVLSLRALNGLADILAEAAAPLPGGAEAPEKIDLATGRAIRLAEKLSPLLDEAVTPSGRLHLEQDQQAVAGVSTAVLQYVGPALGVAQGFNALDGDGG